MAITLKQTVSGFDNNGNTGSVSASVGTVTAGSTLIAIIGTGSGDTTKLTSFSDTASNTWIRILNHSNANYAGTVVYYSPNAKAQSTVVSVTDGFYGTALTVFEIGGLATGTNFDKTSTGAATLGPTISSGATATTTNANEFVLGIGIYGGVWSNWTLGSGFSNLLMNTTNGISLATESLIQTSAQTQTANFGGAITNNYNYAHVLTFSDTTVASIVTKTQPTKARISKAITKTQGAVAHINAGAVAGTKTQTAVGRISNAATKTQGAVASIVAAGSLTPGVIWHDGATTSTNYNNVGANTTVGGNNGMFGTLGASGSIHIAYSGGNYVYEGVQKTLPSNATIFQFYYRSVSTATIGTGNTIFSIYPDGTYAGANSPIRIDVVPSSTSGNLNLRLMDNSNSYANVTGSTNIPLGAAIRVTLYQTSAGWYLYLNNGTTPEVTYTRTQATIGWKYIALGTVYNNATGSYIGVADIDEIWCGNLNTTPTTTAGKIYDAYLGYVQNHVSAEGQPYRGPADGGTLAGAAAIDTVSESAAYTLKLAVQNNDQTTFNLVDNWVLQNLLRSVSTTGNTQNNGAPTNALNLMAFHYNSANTDGKGIGTIYDANWAADGDIERGQAMLWAHSRWGSSSYTVGTTNELSTPNYLARANSIISDLRTYAFGYSSYSGNYYLYNDSFQTGNDTFVAGGDYEATAAFKLFGQYDSSHISFWNSTVTATYDRLNQTAGKQMTSQGSAVGLNSDWVNYTLSTGQVGAGTTAYGNTDYGYNSFRSYPRLYDAYTWYADSNALTSLRNPKSFFTNYYNTNTSVSATFKHDGTNPAAYTNTLFGYPAYFVMTAGDSGNTVGAGINTTYNLANLYSQQPYGSIISNASGSNQYGYFDQSWNLVYAMQRNGTWTNYGQAAAQSTKTQTSNARIQKTLGYTQPAIARVQKSFTKTQNAITGVAGQLATTLFDDFSGASPDYTKWFHFASTFSQSGGVAYTFLNTDGSGASITSLNKYNILGSQFKWDYLNPTFDSAVVGSYNEIRLSFVNGNIFSFLHTGDGKVQAYYNSISVGSSSTYSASTMKSWRFKEASGTLYLDYSADSISWTTLYSFTTPAGAYAVSWATGGNTNAASGGGQNAYQIDNFNLSGSTKVQGAVSRISKSFSLTQGSISRIQKTFGYTETANARIQKSFTKTQASLARLANSNVKTQPSVGRVSKSFTKTQPSIARIANVFIKTQGSISRVSSAVAKNQTATGRIQSNTTKTQSAIGTITTASNTAFTSPTSVVDDATYGGYAWVNPGNATASDNTYATSTGNVNAASPTHYLKSTGYGFAIPANAIINGIIVYIEYHDNYGLIESSIRLLKAGTYVGTDHATATSLSFSSDVVYARGGASDLWGTTWTASDINNANFGFSTSYQMPADNKPTPIASVDQMQMVIYYTVPQNLSKTQTAIARLTNTVTKTQPETARIQKSVVLTQTANGRVSKSFTKTQSSISRLSKVFTNNQSALSRISKSLQFIQNSNARLSKQLNLAQTARGRISKSFTLSQPAISRIALTTSKTQNAISKVVSAVGHTYTQAANARVAAIVSNAQNATATIANTLSTDSFMANFGTAVTFTQSAISRIQITGIKNQSSVARISKSIAKTQSSIARILNVAIYTQSGIARISKTVTKTQNAVARISKSVSNAQPANGRISKSFIFVQSAVARITKTLSLAQTGNTRISKSFILVQGSISRISKSLTKTQPSISRIQKLLTLTQGAVARITKTLSFTQSTNARISKTFTLTQGAIARVSKTVTRTQGAIANIVVLSPNSLTQGAIARLSKSITKTQTAVVRISKSFTLLQISNARISKSFTLLQTTNGRISKSFTLTQGAISRVSKTFTYTQGSIARVAKTGVLTQTSNARIAKAITKTQSAIARVSKSLNYTEPANARISKSFVNNQSAISRIQRLFTLTQLANTRITKTVTAVQPVIARIVILTGYFINQPAKSRILNTNMLAVQTALGRVSKSFTTTRSAIARIALNAVRTQNAVARIIRIVSAVQSANGRISKSIVFNQPAIARISKSFSLNQPSISRISKSFAFIQPAIARLSKTTTKTQSSIARLANVFIKTQGAIGRIAKVFTLVQSAISRIAVLRSLTQSSIARIANSFTKTQGSIARIAKALSLTQPANGRISKSFTATQSTKARISKSFTLTQPSISRIASLLVKTQSAVARIRNTNMVAVQSAIARVTNQTTKLQTSNARIFNTNLSKLQGAIARIAKSFARTQGAIARIANNLTKVQLSNARITKVIIRTQNAIARIANSFTKTQTSNGRISKLLVSTHPAIARVQKLISLTQSANTRISKSFTKTQTAIARIAHAFTTTHPANARISRSFALTQTTIGRISKALTSSRPANARLSKGITLAQPANARISKVGVLTQGTQARITATYTLLETAEARIEKSISLAQFAIARVAKTIWTVQTATADISKNFAATQIAISRIAHGYTLTQSASALIFKARSFNQISNARVRRVVVKTQTASGYIIQNIAQYVYIEFQSGIVGIQLQPKTEASIQLLENQKVSITLQNQIVKTTLQAPKMSITVE
jgi:hypothetical protein